MNEPSDPNIVARLAKMPPYDEEPVQQEQEEPQEQQEEEQPTSQEDTEVPTTGQITEEAAQTEAPVEDEQKKRTADEFAKLKEHNAALKKQLEEFEAKKAPQKNALDALFPQTPEPMVTNVVPSSFQQNNTTLTPKEIKDAFANLTDDQGYVDTGLLKETLSSLVKAKEEAERRADEAIAQVKKVERRQDDFERNNQMREVHRLYPKLDPQNANLPDGDPNKFDDRFYAQFQKEIMYKWSTVGTADPMQVAAEASDIIYGLTMKKAEKEKAEQAELAKRNINASAAKPSATHQAYKDQDELIAATRKGVPGALAERLARAGQ